MQAGTGARPARSRPGVRVYGKTGTADSIGIEDEILSACAYNECGPPHSWFLGIAEDEHAEPRPGDDAAPHRHRGRGPARRPRRARGRSRGHGDPGRGPVAGLLTAQGGAARTAGGATGAGGDGLALAGRRGKAPITVVSPVLATPPPAPRRAAAPAPAVAAPALARRRPRSLAAAGASARARPAAGRDAASPPATTPRRPDHRPPPHRPTAAGRRAVTVAARAGAEDGTSVLSTGDRVGDWVVEEPPRRRRDGRGLPRALR